MSDTFDSGTYDSSDYAAASDDYDGATFDSGTYDAVSPGYYGTGTYGGSIYGQPPVFESSGGVLGLIAGPSVPVLALSVGSGAVLTIHGLDTSYIPVTGTGLVANTGPIQLRNYTDYAFPTQITAPMGLFDSSVKVQSTYGYPPAPFAIVIDKYLPTQETCLVTAILDNSHFAITRAFNNGQLMIHDINAIVEHDTISLDYQEANEHHTDTTRDDHLSLMRTDGTRHNVFERHLIGVTLEAGMPTASAPGDVASVGTSPLVAGAFHTHGRESAASLATSFFPVGLITMFPAVTTIAPGGQQSLSEIFSTIAIAPPYGNATNTTDTQLTNCPVPDGWLYCDGSLYTQEQYPLLYTVLNGYIGYFNVPDLVPSVSATNTQGYLGTLPAQGYYTVSTTVENPLWGPQQDAIASWECYVRSKDTCCPQYISGYRADQLILMPFSGYFVVNSTIAQQVEYITRVQTYPEPKPLPSALDLAGVRYIIKADQ